MTRSIRRVRKTEEFSPRKSPPLKMNLQTNGLAMRAGLSPRQRLIIERVTGNDSRRPVVVLLDVKNDLRTRSGLMVHRGTIFELIHVRAKKNALRRTRRCFWLLEKLTHRILERLSALIRERLTILRNTLGREGKRKKGGGEKEAGQCFCHDTNKVERQEEWRSRSLSRPHGPQK